MHYCCVKLCGKNTKTSGVQKDGISFHRFPKCPNIKEMWIDATKRSHDWFPSRSSVICSRHFQSEYFILTKSNSRRILYSNAVPTLHLPIVVSGEGTRVQSQNTFPEVAQALPKTENIAQAFTTDHDDSSTSSQATASYIVQPDTKTDYLEANFTDTPQQRCLHITIAGLRQKLKQSRSKIKRLQSSNRTMKNQITSLRSLVKELKDKH